MRKLSISTITLLVAITIGITAFKPGYNKQKNVDNSIATIVRNANYETTKWVVDKAHSSVTFSVAHMVIAEVDGSFKIFDGSLEHSKSDFSDAKIRFTIDANSINTNNEGRDKHLKSSDFFNTEKYPQMKFESLSLTPISGNKYKLIGNLSMLDVTKEVTFDVTYGGTVSGQRGTKAGFKATGVINRFDFNLSAGDKRGNPSPAIGEEVRLTVKLELNQVKSDTK